MNHRSTFRKKDTPTEKPPEQTPKRKNIRGRLFLVGLAVFGVYVGIGYLVSIPSLRIETVTLSGNNVLVLADLTPSVDSFTDGYRFWPYRNDSIFVIPKKKIKENLFETFERLENISIRKRGLKEIEIVVKEKEGEYFWCGGIDKMESTVESCFIIDAKGVLFDVAPQVSGDAYFKIFGGGVDMENPIGSELFSLSDFNKIIEIKDQLKNHKLDPIALVLYEDGLMEFIKKTEGKNLYEGARIKFTLLVSYEEAMNNLLSALNSEPLKTEFAEKERLLEYIDIRFDNRVYYKFR